nr:hypothetical protein [uncultured Draconibacterium sp.]
MEQNQEIYNIEKGTSNVTITHQEGLGERAPIAIAITGNIDSPFNWLKKRVLPAITVSQNNIGCDVEVTEEEVQQDEIKAMAIEALKCTIENIGKSVNTPNPDHMIEQHEAHVVINREKMTICLVINEINPLLKGDVQGKLELHPDFKQWEINTGGSWDHEELAEFIKMNRSCFAEKKEAMKLSAGLKNLRVNVEKEVEKQNDNRGNYRAMAVQKVKEMSIPAEFSLQVPIFKGQSKISFNVEIYIDPHNYKISLVSPDANDAVADVRDNIIDEQKQKIIDLAPELVIIEQ